MKKIFTFAVFMMAFTVAAIAQQLEYDQPIDQNVNPELLDKPGHVIGMGRYCHGATAYVIAVPDDGYYFAGWSDGNMDNPRIFVVEYSIESRFEKLPERILQEQQTEDGLKIFTNDLTLRVEGEILNDYQVFTTTGLMIYSGRGNYVDLPMAGIYLVRSNNVTYKILAK